MRKKRTHSEFSRVREEHGYGGIKAIGITWDGEIVIEKKDELDFLINHPSIIKTNPVSDALSAPIKVFFNPSLRCPMKCTMCLSSRSEYSCIKNTPHLNHEIVEEIANQIIKSGVLWVKIGGGEPLLFEYFFDLVKKLRDAGIYVSTSTSGFMIESISKKKIALLKKYNVKISVSIDGDEKFHNKLRGNKNLYKKAIAGIERLINNGINTEIRSTINNTRESYEQLDHLIFLAHKYGKRVRIRITKPVGDALKNNLSISYPTIEYWNFYKKARSHISDPLLSFDENIAYDREAPYSKFEKGLDCAGGSRKCFINCFGEIVTCDFISFKFPFKASIIDRKTTLIREWRSGKQFKLVRNYYKKENMRSRCRNCKYVNNCQGGCPAFRLRNKLDRELRCPLFADVYTKLKDGQFAKITTGSKFTYIDKKDKKYIVFTAEIGSPIVIGTPGGAMDGAKDFTLQDTIKREIFEEIGINKKDLFVSEKPIIIKTLSHNNQKSLLNIFEVHTSKTPIPTPENPIIILISQESLKKIKSNNPKNLNNLKKLGCKIITNENIKIRNQPVRFIGAADAIINDWA